ncbi:monovalent cation/H(+) antiporter subunit G [Devosia albogilva]|uniref:Monovalent cation/H(+) antiporter subunit G n=1 Tax=Devosia albogilva TaxID=429726 RepID=A0ABW5QFT6_9HYPH
MADLPLWLAVLLSVCVLMGAALTLAGCFGLVRLNSFYLRMHSPTMGTSMGGGLILLTSALYFTFTEGRAIFPELAIFAFMSITTPVTLMLLARATLFRDRLQQKLDADAAAEEGANAGSPERQS